MSVYNSQCIRINPGASRSSLFHSATCGAADSKEAACNAGDPGSIPGAGSPLEKGMATHTSILSWRTSWTEEPGGLQSMGLQRIGHDRVTDTSTLGAQWAVRH